MPRFYQGKEWRWVVLAVDDWTTPSLRITTFLDHLATDAAVDRNLNDPMQISLDVPSDNPQVWLEYGDGEPVVADGRILVGMRRDAAGGDTWVPYASGIILNLSDFGDTSGAAIAHTTVTAYDPWQLLYRRPVCFFNGDLPTADEGLKFVAEPADNVALALLFNTEAAHGLTLIDSSGLPGNELDPITITFERGLTVGEAWKQLCDAAYMDIVLDPTLDLGGGYISTLRIAAKAGSPRYNAQFVWDGPGRSSRSIDRVEDGTLRTNKVQEYNGEGGFPVALQTDAASVAEFGESWLIQAQAKTTLSATALKLAQTDLAARKDGVTTITVSPMPERSPVPFTDYDIGDQVYVQSSARSTRKEVTGLWRVTKIPVRFDGSGRETVEALEVTTDVTP